MSISKKWKKNGLLKHFGRSGCRDISQCVNIGLQIQYKENLTRNYTVDNLHMIDRILRYVSLTVLKQGWNEERRFRKSLLQAEIVFDSCWRLLGRCRSEGWFGRWQRSSGLSSATSHDLAISWMSVADFPFECIRSVVGSWSIVPSSPAIFREYQPTIQQIFTHAFSLTNIMLHGHGMRKVLPARSLSAYSSGHFSLRKFMLEFYIIALTKLPVLYNSILIFRIKI